LDGLSVHHQKLKTAYIAKVYVKQLLLPAAIGNEIELQEFYLWNSMSSISGTPAVPSHPL
jgi:hypothetical protein